MGEKGLALGARNAIRAWAYEELLKDPHWEPMSEESILRNPTMDQNAKWDPQKLVYVDLRTGKALTPHPFE